MADSRNWYGHVANFCKADNEYGRAPRRCESSIGLVAAEARTNPS